MCRMRGCGKCKQLLALKPQMKKAGLNDPPPLDLILKSLVVPQLQPLVAPQVSHFSQVPFRTMVKFWHSEHILPV